MLSWLSLCWLKVNLDLSLALLRIDLLTVIVRQKKVYLLRSNDNEMAYKVFASNEDYMPLLTPVRWRMDLVDNGSTVFKSYDNELSQFTIEKATLVDSQSFTHWEFDYRVVSGSNVKVVE